MILKAEYIHHHIDALLRLSRDVQDPTVSAKLQEMADQFRIFVSVADVTGLVSDLKRDDFCFVPSALASNPANVKSFKGPGRVSAHHRIGDHYQ